MAKFDRAGFLIFGLVFVSHDFEVGTNVSCEATVPYAANFIQIRALLLLSLIL